jgi:CHASE3 domain sensor protein
MITREQLQERIRKLTAERDQVVTEANQRISAYSGAIETLQALIEEEDKQTVNGEVSQEMAKVLHE